MSHPTTTGKAVRHKTSRSSGQHCDTFDFGAPPLTSNLDKNCCPSNKAIFDPSTHTNRCCHSGVVESAGVKFCSGPAINNNPTGQNFSKPFHFPVNTLHPQPNVIRDRQGKLRRCPTGTRADIAQNLCISIDPNLHFNEDQIGIV